MATDWKNLSFGAPRKWGKAEKKPVTNEDNGTRAGYHVEHWDDHVDAVAQPAAITVRPKVNEGD
jgi:hypothetical protein